MYHFLMMQVNFELINEGSPNLEIFRFLFSACDARVECKGMVWLIWEISLQWLLISSWFPSNDKFFWQSIVIDMISLKDLNGIVYQLFVDDDGLTLFPWFYNVKIVKGVQFFTIFPRYLHNKLWYLPSNLRLCYLRTYANWSTYKICAISKNEIWWTFGW